MQLSKEDEALIASWKKDVHDKAEDVDPGDEYDWDGLAIGYFLGKGVEPGDAEQLVLALRSRNLL